MVLYVNDVSATGTQWHGVFLADAGGENGSRLTLAENAIVIAEPRQGKLALHLQGGPTHEISPHEAERYAGTDFRQTDWAIETHRLASAPTPPLVDWHRSNRG